MTKSELKKLSNDTFFDNSKGGITPEAHREFNEKLIDSILVSTDRDLKDGEVTESKLGNLAVSSGKIKDSSVTTAKIADNNVTAGKLASGSVTTIKIADSNVTTAKLANSAVTGVKIADATITAAKLASGVIPTSNKLKTYYYQTTATSGSLPVSGGEYYDYYVVSCGGTSDPTITLATTPKEGTKIIIKHYPAGRVFHLKSSNKFCADVISDIRTMRSGNAVHLVFINGMWHATWMYG